MNNKSVSTATVGYMGYALTFWLIGVTDAGWAHGTVGAIFTLAFPVSILLLVVGILALTNERTLDAIVFLGGAALLWSGHAFLQGMARHGAASEGFAGWFFIVWTAFYAWLFVAALQASRMRMLFLLGLTLTLLAYAISFWAGSHVIGVISGYIALATGLLAAWISACAINGHAGAGHLKDSGSTSV